MEFSKLQFNARTAFFIIASDITIVIKKIDNKFNSVDIVGGGKNTISSEYLLHNTRLSDKETEALVNSIENSLKYNI